MKKLASLLLSGALALGLLAGCGGTPGTADTPAANTDTPAAPHPDRLPGGHHPEGGRLSPLPTPRSWPW